MPDEPPDPADFLKRAQRLHGEGRDRRRYRRCAGGVAVRPGLCDALSYLGTTLITRKLMFPEGCSCWSGRKSVAPERPGVAYSLGWCYEFVAYRLEKLGRTPTENRSSSTSWRPVSSSAA